MLPKFKLKKDWYIETDILGIKNKELLYKEGHIFVPNEKEEYHITHGGWSEQTPNIGGRMILSEEGMRTAEDNGEILFQEIPTDEIKMTIKEIDKDDEDKIRSWRIQVDVKTSLTKLKEIQKIIESEVKSILQ